MAAATCAGAVEAGASHSYGPNIVVGSAAGSNNSGYQHHTGMALRVHQGHPGTTPQTSASHPARGAQQDHGGRAVQQTVGRHMSLRVSPAPALTLSP